jgi:hypothetical protein
VVNLACPVSKHGGSHVLENRNMMVKIPLKTCNYQTAIDLSDGWETKAPQCDRERQEGRIEMERHTKISVHLVCDLHVKEASLCIR